jgi:hypothetical protein
MKLFIKNYFFPLFLFYLDTIFITLCHKLYFSLTSLFFIHSFFDTEIHSKKYIFYFFLFLLQIQLFFSNIPYLFFFPFAYYVIFFYVKKYMIFTEFRFFFIKTVLYFIFLNNITILENFWVYTSNIVLCFLF